MAPASQYGTLAEAEKRFDEDLKDPEVAFEVAEHYLKPAQIQKTRDKDAPHSGRKSNWERFIQPLPGEQLFKVDQKVRAIVGLQYQGFNKQKIEDVIGLTRGYVQQLEKRHPEAFDAARADMAKQVMTEYYTNALVIKAALAEAGHKAVETLVGVMNDKNSTPHSRLKAAQTVLQMVDFPVVSGGNGAVGALHEANRLVETFATALEEKKSEYVVDVEAEEVDGDRVGTDE